MTHETRWIHRLLAATMLLALLGGAAGAQEEGALQATSLLGRELRAQAPTAEQAAAIAEAERALAVAPGDPERVLALGSALAAVWRYRDAIEVYGRGIEAYPEHAALYRHRGHRHLSLRDFASAEADLERAAGLYREDLGAALGFDVWYHLGLARYLQGDWAGAAEAYRRCRETIAEDDDESLVAVSHWLYMTLRRGGRAEEAEQVLAPIRGDLAVEENRAYHDLLRLYRGEVGVDDIYDPATATPLDLATTGYGVANWWLYGGEQAKARELFARIVEGPYWPAFGYIAAEVEVARAGGGGNDR
jgi:tetratricopeptide (TPR) repeat protein